MKSAMNQPPPMYVASPSMPYQYQPYAVPPGAVPMHPQQTIIFPHVQPGNEPDYLGYSIFTLFCCFFPLGIISLFFSIKTLDSNRQGDIASAKRYSRLALTLNHTALGLGIAWMALTIILIIVYTIMAKKTVTSIQGDFGDINP